MPSDGNPMRRRTVLRLLGASGAGAASPIAAASARGTQRELPPRRRARLDELAIETALHPERPGGAMTTIGLGDGYQLYYVDGVESADETVHVERDLVQLSRAEAGVHGVHWISPTTLRYSQDGRTLQRSFGFDGRGEQITPRSGTVTVVDDRPLPVHRTDDFGAQSVDIPYPIDCRSSQVCCTDLPYVTDWCVRVTGSDTGHSPECSNFNPGPMRHGHFAIFPEGNYRRGVNIWSGVDGNCVWVGEEHATKWCTRVCGPEGGMPSLADLRDAFEEAIERAAAEAGIAIPAIVVVALAYYLAASTLAPPTGVPLI